MTGNIFLYNKGRNRKYSSTLPLPKKNKIEGGLLLIYIGGTRLKKKEQSEKEGKIKGSFEIG